MIDGVVLLLVSFGIYFLPTICVVFGKRKNAMAITVLNLFLGWTIIGWVVSLVWALTDDK